MKFLALAECALLGTERQLPPDAAPGAAVTDLLSQLNPGQRESYLLSAGALTFQYERVGALPRVDNDPLPEPCPHEEQPRVSAPATRHLLALLAGDYQELLPEWLVLAARTHQLAPPEALPALLAIGASKPALREVILPVLGVRGCWLAAQNEQWSWVAGESEDENLWQTGPGPSRLAFLQHLRRRHPERAREILASTWKEEAIEDRACFVTALGEGLCLEDEAFLETVLEDRSKSVRECASRLLSRLPESQLVQRMIARVRPLLKFTPPEPGKISKLMRSKPAALDVTLPESCDKAMQRDGLDPKPPPGTGVKIWLLRQMISRIPVAYWEREWGVPPAAIIAAMGATEWADDLISGLVIAVENQHYPGWGEELIRWLSGRHGLDLKTIMSLLKLLPAERRNELMATILDQSGFADWQLVSLLCEGACSQAWGELLSRKVLRWLRGITAKLDVDWHLRDHLRDLAPFMAPEILADIATGWPVESAGWSGWFKSVEEFIAMARFRQEMRASILNYERNN